MYLLAAYPSGYLRTAATWTAATSRRWWQRVGHTVDEKEGKPGGRYGHRGRAVYAIGAEGAIDTAFTVAEMVEILPNHSFAGIVCVAD